MSDNAVWKTVKPFMNGGLSGMGATCIIQPLDIVKASHRCAIPLHAPSHVKGQRWFSRPPSEGVGAVANPGRPPDVTAVRPERRDASRDASRAF